MMSYEAVQEAYKLALEQTEFMRKETTMRSPKPELGLKWGTYKSSNFPANTPSYNALERYFAAEGVQSASAMLQRDSEAQKLALCELCDVVEREGGTIYLYWDGEYINAEQAKKYIMEYRRS